MTTERIRIAPVVADKAQPVLELCDEMDQFYGQHNMDSEVRQQRLSDALFGAVPKAYALAAWHGDRAVGLASYSYLWPAEDLTTSLYVKELFVTAGYRHRGVGRQLLAETCAVAQAQQCTRLELGTELANRGARGFYARLGLPVNATEVVRYRLGVEDIGRLAATRTA